PLSPCHPVTVGVRGDTTNCHPCHLSHLCRMHRRKSHKTRRLRRRRTVTPAVTPPPRRLPPLAKGDCGDRGDRSDRVTGVTPLPSTLLVSYSLSAGGVSTYWPPRTESSWPASAMRQSSCLTAS